MISKISLILMFQAILLIPNISFGASFNCENAKSNIDILICMDYRLSDLDFQMDNLYTLKLAELSNQNVFKNEQLNWIQQRNKCQKFICVFKSYVKRISQLSPHVPAIHQLAPSPSKPWDYEFKKYYSLNSPYINSDRNLVFEIFDKHAHSKGFINFENGKITPRSTQEVENLTKLDANLWPSKNLQSLGEYSVGEASPNIPDCSPYAFSGGIKVHKVTAANILETESQDRQLVAFAVRRNSLHKAKSTCETSRLLNIDPLSFSLSYVISNSLYFFDEQFVVRFDDKLNSESKLIGRNVYFVWANDLRSLIGEGCYKYSDGIIARTCINNQLQKLMNKTQFFYK